MSVSTGTHYDELDKAGIMEVLDAAGNIDARDGLPLVFLFAVCYHDFSKNLHHGGSNYTGRDIT